MKNYISCNHYTQLAQTLNVQCNVRVLLVTLRYSSKDKSDEDLDDDDVISTKRRLKMY